MIFIPEGSLYRYSIITVSYTSLPDISSVKAMLVIC